MTAAHAAGAARIAVTDLQASKRERAAKLGADVVIELRSLAAVRDDYRVDQRAALHEQRALLELTWPQLLVEVPDLVGSHLQATLRLGLLPIEVAAMSRARVCSRRSRAAKSRLVAASIAGVDRC